MLNIIKLKLKNKYKSVLSNTQNITIHYKDFTPNIRDWKNSIYVYNKNSLKLIPEASNFVIKLIRGYFNLYNLNLESKIRKKRLRRRLRKISTHKIFVNDGEFKHTNDKINITLYHYNRQKSNYLFKINQGYIKLFKGLKFKTKLLLIRKIGLNIIQKEKNNKNILMKALTSNNINKNLYIKKYENLYYKLFVKKSLKRIMLYVYYKQLLFINNSKFNNFYLQGLISLIKKIYKKNVEFNLINLKYFYYNSDIMTQSIILKLRKDRKKLLNYLNTCITKARIGNIQTSTRPKYYFDLDYLNLFIEKKLDTTNDLLYKLLIQNKTESKDLKKLVLNYIKYKKVSGIRIEAAGRLTKRYTASRSMLKTKYKGNLENISSSINGYPSALLRGNFKPNIQYTKLESKSRIGSFGVKGWVSGI